MAKNGTENKVTQSDYWCIQVRNAEFKSQLAKHHHDRLQQLLTWHEHETSKMIQYINGDNMSAVFDMLISNNINLTKKIQSLQIAADISNRRAIILCDTACQLASKPEHNGTGQTSEMSTFITLMQSHLQMYQKQWWHSYQQSQKTSVNSLLQTSAK